MLLLTLLVALFGGLFTPSSAHAAECTPDATTACVQGIIKTSDGQPAAGITVTLTGGSEDLQTQTGADGRWVFSVTTAGAYTVAVDEATLPKGQFLKSLSSREVQAELGNSKSALFPLTDDPNAKNGASGSPGADHGGEKGTDAGNTFSWQRFWQQAVSGVRMGLLIALASLGLSLVFGTTGLSNFAQGEMVTLGGLLAAAFMSFTGNLWLAGLLAVVVSAAFGWAQDKVIWKPLRKRRLSLMQLMIVSIGLSITMQYFFQLVWGSGVVRIDKTTAATVTFAGISITVQSLVAMGISAVAIAAVGFGLMFTRFGRATRAISDNPALAQASGIDVDRVINIVWIVGGGLAGLA
ncbi:MAG: branched-chain amino acid ABC transporter permease, partial [Actinobacteria bacterium]|nr:branched-chain amino acid ABC transporter permease [Actinomycetota bacterium]